MFTSALQYWAETRGYQTAWGPVRALVEARSDIRRRHDNSELDPKLYHTVLRRFVETAPELSDGTLILVAVPRPAHRMSFQFDGDRFDAILPPAYIDFRETTTAVRDDLATNVLVESTIEPLMAPLKAVATRLGLVRYGRNNITYATGLGSYLQLCGYVINEKTPKIQIAIREPRLLEQCASCDLCVRTCPTKAIDTERILVHAHRCLTFANELPGDWPDWVPRRAHNCLMGCLLCQRPCPANPPLKVLDTECCFSENETLALMRSPDEIDEFVTQEISKKVRRLGDESIIPLLGRNLKALLERRTVTPLHSR